MTGNIRIVEATENFTKINKSLIYNLDYKVVGIYCKIMTLGKKWKLDIKGLSQALKKNNQPISEKKIREAMLVLEEEGYMRRSAIKDEHGRFQGWDYFFYAEPIPTEERTRAGKSSTDITTTDLPKTDKSVTDITEMGKRLYRDNKILDSTIQDSNHRESKENNPLPNFESFKDGTKELSSVEAESRLQDKERKNSAKKRESGAPSNIEEVHDYFKLKGFRADEFKFWNYYQARGWEGIKDWKALADLWESREKGAEPQPRGEKKRDSEYEEFIKKMEER